MASRQIVEVLTPAQSELVFAVVGPTGINLDVFEQSFIDLLKQFHYDVNVLRLSKMAERLHTEKLGVQLDTSTEFRRINSLMDAGNRLRTESGRGDFLALHAISEINEERAHANPPMQPFLHTAHLLRSLKHPREVEALRRVYGVGFFLIGVHSRESERISYLKNLKGLTDDEAKLLVARDQSEDEELGQHTRDAFMLSDVFVRADSVNELARFLELVFGNPFITPEPNEYAMFLAHAAALRSAQLARQVGAVIVSAQGDVIATGANDVPKFGGGLYWPGKGDQRDHLYREKEDSNDREIARMIEDTITAAKSAGVTIPDESLLREKLLTGRLGDVTEYGRPVHAEMEALLTCARIGQSPVGGDLFTTTFPCHNCAKHIVAAGINRVFFVEPYPKSKAQDLHGDSIVIDDDSPKNKVKFLPFVGVAARRYFDLFSMKLGTGAPLRRKAEGGKAATWERSQGRPRSGMSPWSYIDRERQVIELIETAVEKMEQKGDKPEAAKSGPFTGAEVMDAINKKVEGQ